MKMDKEKDIKTLMNSFLDVAIYVAISGGLVLFGYSWGSSGNECSSYKNYLTDLATQNHVVYDMSDGNRGFIFEDRNILLYNPSNKTFTMSTIEDERLVNNVRTYDIDEKIENLETKRNSLTEFEAKVDSLYNSIIK